jgi:hypothetical protein
MLAIASAVADGAILVVDDGTMSVGNYTNVRIHGDVSDVLSVMTPGSIGNPGSFMDEYLSRSVAAGSPSYVVHLNFIYTYDPATLGAIGSLDAAFDGTHRNGDLGLIGRLAIQQGDSIFASKASLLGGDIAEWKTFHQTLTANDFMRISGTGTLDFSSTGGILQLGVLNEIAAGGAGYGLNGFDNLRVSVNEPTAIVAVPEPASLALWACGMLSFTLSFIGTRSRCRR